MMRRRGWPLVLRAIAILAALLLAGCSASTPEGGSLDDARGTGLSLDGIVVDNAITPLADVNVTITGNNLTALTDSEGRFRFAMAEPGTVRVMAHKAGYIEQSIDVEVVADGGLVQIKMEAVPIPVPTASVKEWTGLLQCGLRTPQDGYAVCKLADDLTGVVGDDADERYGDIDTPPTYVQVEMEWESTQPLGSSLRLMLTDDHRQGLDNYAVATGNSPLMVSADNATLQFKHLDTQGLYIRVFTGDFQGVGASLTLQQSFTVYTVVFQNYRPDPAWLFTDGGGIPPA